LVETKLARTAIDIIAAESAELRCPVSARVRSMRGGRMDPRKEVGWDGIREVGEG